MFNYEFYNPTKIVSGEKSLSKIGFELKRMNVSRPAILSDKVVEKIGNVKRVAAELRNAGIEEKLVFAEIPPESDIKAVEKIAELFRERGCDSIIAVGGGSVLDTAKGVNILVSGKKENLLDLCGMENIEERLYKMVAIPTTSGTGSEATEVAVISNIDKKIKMEFMTSKIAADVAILDPDMTMTMPPKLTAATGMDALTHAIEAFTGRQANPLADIYAVTAVRLILENLEKSVEETSDREAKLAMANGSYLAGAAISNSMVGIVHAIGHAVGAVSKIPHGNVMAILLPHCMRYNFVGAGDRYESLARLALGISKEEFLEKIEIMMAKFKNISGLPLRLSEAGVKREEFEEIAAKAINDGAVLTNPVAFSKKEVMGILEKAY